MKQIHVCIKIAERRGLREGEEALRKVFWNGKRVRHNKAKACHPSAPSLLFVSLHCYISRQNHHWHASLAIEFSVVKPYSVFVFSFQAWLSHFLCGVTIPYNKPTTARYSPANKATLFAALLANSYNKLCNKLSDVWKRTVLFWIHGLNLFNCTHKWPLTGFSSRAGIVWIRKYLSPPSLQYTFEMLFSNSIFCILSYYLHFISEANMAHYICTSKFGKFENHLTKKEKSLSQINSEIKLKMYSQA